MGNSREQRLSTHEMLQRHAVLGRLSQPHRTFHGRHMGAVNALSEQVGCQCFLPGKSGVDAGYVAPADAEGE